MMKLPLGALLLLLACATARADDTITIRALNGYPLPGSGTESAEVRITRSGAATQGKHDIDRFFDEVAGALATGGISADWRLTMPDAPLIEITIAMNGRTLRLASSHIPLERDGRVLVTARGAVAIGRGERDAVLARESSEFRQRRIAFEKILALTLKRVDAMRAPLDVQP